MTNRAEVRDSVVHQIAIELNVDPERVDGARSLRTDLKMDSVAAAKVLFSLEEMHGVVIDLDNATSVDSVVEIVDLLMTALDLRS